MFVALFKLALYAYQNIQTSRCVNNFWLFTHKLYAHCLCNYILLQTFFPERVPSICISIFSLPTHRERLFNVCMQIRHAEDFNPPPLHFYLNMRSSSVRSSPLPRLWKVSGLSPESWSYSPTWSSGCIPGKRSQTSPWATARRARRSEPRAW